jgi:hypothetical protein
MVIGNIPADSHETPGKITFGFCRSAHFGTGSYQHIFLYNTPGKLQRS